MFESWAETLYDETFSDMFDALVAEYKNGEIHKFLGKEYNLTVKTGNFNSVNLVNNEKKPNIILTVNENILKNVPMGININKR